MTLDFENLKWPFVLGPGIAVNMGVSKVVIVKSVPADLSNSDTEILVLASLKEQAFP